MKLKVIIDDNARDIDVPQDMLDQAGEFFAKMDRDMDGGWRMGPEFIEHPDERQRCQIAANRLLTAVSASNTKVAMLMAGYILSRLAGISAVRIDTGGEMLNTELLFETNTKDGATVAAPSPGERPQKAAHLTRADAIARAEKEVTKVFRVGQAYRFATLDRASGRWMESALMSSSEEAQQMRMEAFDQRFEELLESST